MNRNILKVDENRWQIAQDFELEFAQRHYNDGNDNNHWWSEAFDNYRVLWGKHFSNVIEVGCGPHTNLRLILPLISFKRVWLEDPLIEYFMTATEKRRSWIFPKQPRIVAAVELAERYSAIILPEKLEDLSLSDQSIDLCVCINVLDHVQDVQRCLEQILRTLRIGGLLVIGQDLSNQEDFKLCPETLSDKGHPIKVDESYLERFLNILTPVFRLILPRNQGRNPRCHYGTFLLIGRKDAEQSKY